MSNEEVKPPIAGGRRVCRGLGTSPIEPLHNPLPPRSPDYAGEIVYDVSWEAILRTGSDLAVRRETMEHGQYLIQVAERMRNLGRVIERLRGQVKHREDAIKVYLDPPWDEDAIQYAEERDLQIGISRPERSR